jgi:sugar fermentation stimulation protein A
MKISDKPLKRGKLIKRYKRFLTDVELDDGGGQITATCPNTGSMMGLLDEGNPVWLSVSDNPKRKYAHTWEMVEAVNAAGTPARVGLNTGLPNKLVEEAILAGKVDALTGYESLKREQKYGKNSRIDILLSNEAGPACYVEVKNVTLSREGGVAEFPDAVTARGAKHLAELADMVREGHRAVMVYLAQRSDAETFRLAGDIDPAYLDAWKSATDAGVESIALACHLDDEEIIVDRVIDLDAVS